MFKKRTSAVVVLTLVLSLFTATTYANTIEIPSTLKVGLKSVQASSVKITLQGSYKINNSSISNTSITFTIKSGQIVYNGSLYNEILITPTSSSSRVLIESSGKVNTYKGDFNLKVLNGTILPINMISMQDYLKGVLPYEISNSYPLEAIKAQAIVSRTFAMTNLNKHKSDGINLCDTTNCQVYKGESASALNIAKGVDETNNKILTYNGKAASVTFGSSNGGFTESSLNIWGSNEPYLPAQADSYDKNVWPENKVYKTAQIDSMLKAKSHLKSSEKFVKFGKIQKNSSGRVSSMEVVYSDSTGTKTKTLVKEEPRWAFSLRSMRFNVVYSQSNDTYTFSGSGYGHGVGMSQLGMKSRAEAGHKAEDIVLFYFPGTKLETLGISGNDNENETSEVVVAKLGSRGNIVKDIQRDLKKLGYSIGSVDGIFNKTTQDAVKSFQLKEGLKSNGIVYKTTKDLISERSSGK